jgi:CheY-like chemotaxis protein
MPIVEHMAVDSKASAIRANCDVLLVEDDNDIRETLKAVLTDEGYAVGAACNGLEALEQIGSGMRPSLILLDVMMPVMDGDEFLVNLRAQGHVETPVVVVSAARRQAIAGTVGLVRKPIELETLFEIVGRYCDSLTQQRV